MTTALSLNLSERNSLGGLTPSPTAMDKEDHQWMTNRIRKFLPKFGLYWCGGCDRELVGDWKRCPVCGKRNGRRRFKMGAR